MTRQSRFANKVAEGGLGGACSGSRTGEDGGGEGDSSGVEDDKIGYVGLGTWTFFFLEINPRLQVEHIYDQRRDSRRGCGGVATAGRAWREH